MLRILWLPLFIAIMSPLSAFAELKLVPHSQAQLQASFAPVVKKVTPAVVNIYAQKKVHIRTLSPFLNDPIFRQFLGDAFSGGAIRQRIENSLGSGVIIQPSGLVITNDHVIKDAIDIKVILSDRREFAAKPVLTDPKFDLALLKLETQETQFPYLTLADADRLEVGDLVLAVGNPFGVGQTVTSGIISALARATVGVSDFQSFIQTDAPINPGNSGGALVNMNGELVGVNTAIYSSDGGSNGIGFAIPSTMVATFLTNIAEGNIKRGTIIRPWIGIISQSVTYELASSLGIKAPTGVLISYIHPGSPAEKAGLQVGDVITAIDGHPILDEQSFRYRIATYSIGKKAIFTFIHKGEEIQRPIAMLPPPEVPARDIRTLKGKHPFSGAMAANLSPALAEELGISTSEKGVILLSVSETALAYQFGLRKGDIIRAINDVPITNTAFLETFLQKRFTGWVITLKRDTRVFNLYIR